MSDDEGTGVSQSLTKDTNSQQEPKPKPKSKLAQELDRLNERDEKREAMRERRYKKDVRKLVRIMEKERIEKGVELYPNIAETKAAIRGIQTEEEFFALSKDREKLDEETNKLKRQVDDKYGILLEEERPNITALAEERFSKTSVNREMPEHVSRVLTTQEIQDLRLVFGMFDVKSKGYITANDLKRIVAMLGFRATKKVFDGMIKELAGDSGKVTFLHFLEFIIKSQGEGPDPYDEIKQAFNLLDIHDQGYLTFEDLRTSVDESKLHFSNRMLKEMMQEADKTGDGKISLAEFTSIMLQTSQFKFS